MKFEHFALNVPDSRTQAQWYVEHLGFNIARSRADAPYTRFLADETGRIIIEIYSNPTAAIPDYFANHPLCFHVALVSTDNAAQRRRLEQAGAVFILDEPQPDGTQLMMMRDPWGIPLQFCQRTQPFPMP